MAKAKNTVLAGDYAGRNVLCKGKKIYFEKLMYAPVVVDETTVARYEVIDKESSKSLSSAFGRGLVGSALFGTVGMAAGVMSAKNATSVIISIEFNNGDKSLVEVDQKIYKVLLETLFC